MRRYLLAALALCALAPPAVAQNAITQEGTVLQNSPMMFRGNNSARQGAPVGGAPSGQTVTTGDSVVGGRCDYSAPLDSPDGYYWLCLSAKDGTISAGGTKPPHGLKLEIDGTVHELPIDVTFTGTDLSVANNSLLKDLHGQPGQHVRRLGYTVQGDGGSANYNWATANCTAPDDGAQVQPGVTGCWVADFSGMQPTPMLWGARGDGTTNDTVAVQAAIDALAGKTLYLGPHRYCIGTPGLITYRPISIQGETRSHMTDSPLSDKYGFTACTTNINFLTLGNNGTTSSSGGIIENVLFDLGTAGLNTSGAAIVNNDTYGNEIKNVRINKACIGIDEQKSAWGRVSGVAIRNEYQDLSTYYCGGIRVGASSVAAQTIDYHISDVHVDVPGPWSLLVLDAGGLYIDHSDFLVSRGHGTWLAPGSGQQIMWMTANSSYLADSLCESGLMIEPSSSGGLVAGAQFTQTWTSSSGACSPDSTSGHGVEIRNRNGGWVNGIHFLGHRSYYNGASGFVIGPNVNNVTIDASLICRNGWRHPGAIGDGVLLDSGASNVAIRNSTIGSHCSDTETGTADTQRFGIVFSGTASNVTITGNDLRGNIASPIGGTIPGGDSIITNNTGVDTSLMNVAAGASIELFFPQISMLTGPSATITNVGGMWNARRADVFARDAAQTFATGGNMCNGATVAQGTLAVLQQVPILNCISVK